LKEDEGLGLTLTGADAGTFERLPAQGPNQIEPSDCSLLLPIRTDPPIGR
jgi:hypothetical protein